jgi:DNA-binding NarL/FixJ family response regulator
MATRAPSPIELGTTQSRGNDIDKKIKVMLAEDHALLREGLKLLIRAEPGYEVIAETADGAAVEQLVREVNPELLLLDLDLPGARGNEIALRLKSQCASVKIIILTGSLNPESLRQALATGVDGYVIKHEETSELLRAMQAVIAGKQYVSKGIADMFDANRAGHNTQSAGAITPREREILGLIASGATNQEISERLFLSVLTVRTHRRNLMEKLNLRNGAEITAYAVKYGHFHTT